MAASPIPSTSRPWKTQTEEISPGWKTLLFGATLGAILALLRLPAWSLAIALVVGLWGIWRVLEGRTLRRVAEERVANAQKDRISELKAELENRPSRQ